MKNDLLVLNPEYLKKAGIALDNGKDAAANARAAIIADNGGKGYVPQNPGSDTVIQIMDYARRQIAAGENANKQVCIALASVDMAHGYETAQDRKGNPYTSMLSFAMDILPNLAKSTVAGLLAVGRNIYVPAIQKRFGATSSILLDLPPSTLDALKANLSNPDTRGDTIEVLKAAKGDKVTQKLAKSIAKIVRDRASMGDDKPPMKASEILKAAKGDAPQLERIYGKTESSSKPNGATRNGGNAESKATGNNDEYNAVLALMRTYVKAERTKVVNDKDVETTVTTLSMDAQTLSSFCGALRKFMLASDDNAARYACRALADILEK